MWWSIVTILDFFLFALIALSVAYLLFFAIASTRYQRVDTGTPRKKGRFLIIITTIAQDEHIEDTLQSLLKQTYDSKDYDIVIVGDNLKPLQAMKLAQYPVELLLTKTTSGTKSQAQIYAINNHKSMKIYDQVILLNANDMVDINFLDDVNNVLQAGIRFSQLHRKPLHLDSDAEILSCTFDEINNSIFRKGHIACGMPSALSSSATVLDYQWYKNNAEFIDKNDGEKSIEALLLKQNIFIDYIDEICVCHRGHKTRRDIVEQRNRWMESRLSTFFTNLKQLCPAILHWNLHLSDKLFQWIMMPRIIMMAIILLMSLILPFIYFTMVLKWWALLLIATFAFAMATPDYIVDRHWIRSFRHIPLLLVEQTTSLLLHNTIARKILHKNPKNKE